MAKGTESTEIVPYDAIQRPNATNQRFLPRQPRLSPSHKPMAGPLTQEVTATADIQIARTTPARQPRTASALSAITTPRLLRRIDAFVETNDERRFAVLPREVMQLMFSDDDEDRINYKAPKSKSYEQAMAGNEVSRRKKRRRLAALGCLTCCLCCIFFLLALMTAVLYTQQRGNDDNDNPDVIVVNTQAPTWHPSPELRFCCLQAATSHDPCGTCTSRVTEKEGLCGESYEGCDLCKGKYCVGLLARVPTTNPTANPALRPTTAQARRPMPSTTAPAESARGTETSSPTQRPEEDSVHTHKPTPIFLGPTMQPTTAAQKLPITERNLFKELYGNYYVNQYYNDNIDYTISQTGNVFTRANLEAMKDISSAVWIDTKERIRAPEGRRSLEDEVDPTRYFYGVMQVAAAAQPSPLVVIIVYNLWLPASKPDTYRICVIHIILVRPFAGPIATAMHMPAMGKCAAFITPTARPAAVSGGKAMIEEKSLSSFCERRCDYLNSGNCEEGLEEYKHEYIDPIADVLEEYDSRVPVVAIIEPDSLPNFATNLDDPRCGNPGTQKAYTEGIKYAIETIAARTNNVAIYLDAAHGAWLGWERNLELFVGLVKDMRIDHLIRGFATNVANYQGTGEPCPDYVDCINTHAELFLECCADPCGLLSQYNRANNEHNYARRLIAAMKQAMPSSDHLHAVIDTGRNGNPSSRSECGNWCNIRGASIGKIPTYDTLDPDTVDAYYWVKTPGESDGCSQLLPSSEDPYVASSVCPRFDEGCASDDSLGTHVDEPYAPEAGDWFLYQIQMLATDFIEWQEMPEPSNPAQIEKRNLFAEYDFYVNPVQVANLDATIDVENDPVIRDNLDQMRGFATGIWIDQKAKIEGTDLRTLEGTLRRASAMNPAPLCVFVLHNLPNRGCNAITSSYGEICCTYNTDGTCGSECNYENSGSCTAGLNEYRLEYINPIAEVLATYDGIVPIALVIEPNSLSNLVTPDALQRCHNYGTRNSYIEGIKYAVEHIAARTNSVAMYIDGGHGGWLGWTSSLQSFAELVKSLQIHLHLRGFALNTANYQPEGEPCPEYVDCNTAVGLDCCVDPCNLLGGSNHVGNNEHNYAIALANEMQLVMNDWTHLHMIIDTSRNGEPNARLQCSNWCNIRDARIGRPPSASTLDTDRVDAYYWIKPPGESDGCTEFLPSIADPFIPGARCTRFNSMCASIDSIGTQIAEPNAPKAGDWFDWYVLRLARGASHDETPSTPITKRNIFAENTYYVNPNYVRNLDRTIQTALLRNDDPNLITQLTRMKGIGSANWFDVKRRFWGNTTDTLHGILLDAAKQVPPPLVVFIVYNLPNRDCHAYASNGEICCTYLEDGRCDYDNSGDCADGLAEYQHEYIDPYAEVLSIFDGRVPVALVLEPDSLPNFVTNLNDTRCGNAGTQRAYREGISYAVRRFAELAPNTAMYLDAAHGAWLGWQSNLESFVHTVKSLRIHSLLRGYAINVANYQFEGVPCPDDLDCIRDSSSTVSGLECCYDPCNLLPTYNRANNEHNYARRLVAASRTAMPDFDPHIIIDTGGHQRSTFFDCLADGRNGNPSAREDCGNFCNVRGARVGHIPTADTRDPDIVDAYFWLKTPGESDGCTEYLPSEDDPYVQGEACPRFDLGCASVDSLGTSSGEPYAPEAGDWFLYQINMLARGFDGKLPTPAPTLRRIATAKATITEPSVRPSINILSEPRPPHPTLAHQNVSVHVETTAPVVRFGAIRVNGTHLLGEGTQATTEQGFCCFASTASQEQGASKAEFCAACTAHAFSTEFCGQNETNCAGACGNAGGWCPMPESASQERVQLVGMSLFWSNSGWSGYKYYTSGVVRTLAQDWRCSVVRAAMGVEESGGYITDRDANIARICTVVEAAIANNIYVIIDFHSHNAENYVKEAQAFFSDMAEMYGAYPNVIFEIYNEPINTPWSIVTDPLATDSSYTIKGYAESVIPIIRSKSNNLILVGTRHYSQNVWEPALDPLDCFFCTNIAYVFHFYAATHGAFARSVLKKAVLGRSYEPKAGEVDGWAANENPVRLPVFISEYGMVEASGDGVPNRTSISEWTDFLDAHGISHVNWAINDKDKGASALLPGSDANGAWEDSDLSPSGKLARQHILRYFA